MYFIYKCIGQPPPNETITEEIKHPIPQFGLPQPQEKLKIEESQKQEIQKTEIVLQEQSVKTEEKLQSTPPEKQ